MNGDADISQTALDILFQMVTHLMGFFHTGIFRQKQVKVNKAMAARLTGSHLVKTGQLTGVFPDG
jgi:hypothetical protein